MEHSRTPQIDAVVRRFRGRTELAKRVLDAFVRQNETDMLTLRNALAHSDFDTVAKMAHKIKGSAANTGIEPMRQHAEQIETFDQTDGEEDLQVHVARLDDAWKQLKKEYQHASAAT